MKKLENSQILNKKWVCGGCSVVISYIVFEYLNYNNEMITFKT